jgi:predicted nucleotidyltransferase component of viral defense system
VTVGSDHPLFQSSDERAAYFALAAARLGYAPEVVEKDFWVCVALAAMRASEGSLRWVFKGGTSLSKAYGVIDRFS